MRRFAIVAALTVATNLLLAMLPVAVRAISANLYVSWVLSLVCALALYAAVLIVMRIRRTREMERAPKIVKVR